MARMDHRRYNGAALLGLRGLVFKSHGSADARAYEHALNRAYDAARNQLLDKVRGALLPLLRFWQQPPLRPVPLKPCYDLCFSFCAHYRHRQLFATAPPYQP